MKQTSLNSPQPVKVAVRSFAPIYVEKIAEYLREKGIDIEGFVVEFDTAEEREKFKRDIGTALRSENVGFDDLD